MVEKIVDIIKKMVYNLKCSKENRKAVNTMEETMNHDDLARYEHLARFYEIQKAIDSTTNQETLEILKAQKKEISDWLATHDS